MKQFLRDHPFILMEAAVVERLRRRSDICLHERLVNAPLVYDKAGRDAMSRIYRDYIGIAAKANVPLLMCTPTWRASRSRVYESDSNRSINIDAARYMRELCSAEGADSDAIRIGGMIGCKNDCYRPEEALSVSDAEQFHCWQIEQLVAGDVDFLIAETLPNIQEALGIARAMQATDRPYIISFVISRTGYVLDGTRLPDAVAYIDNNTDQQPLGYMVNCAHPSFLCPATQPSALFKRLIGCLGNASSLDHCDLDNAERLEVDAVADWGDLMLTLNRTYGVQILGGCCGTGGEHLHYLAANRR